MELSEETQHRGGAGDGSKREKQLLFAVALISLAGLALEVELTRLFSVLYFPPAVFAILSLAILGIGLGAALVTWRQGWQEIAKVPVYLLLAAAAVIFLVVAATLPALQPLLSGLVVLPYLFIGMSLTAIFTARAQESGRLYMADLLGAGVGALAAVALLNWLGGLNALLSTSLILVLAGLLLASGPLLRYALAALALAALLLVGNLLFNWLAVDIGRLPVEKPIAAALAANAGGSAGTGSVVDTRWDAFARSDLVDPGDGGPYRLYIDGAAGSVMPPAENNEFLWGDIGFFPFATEQPQRVLLIGPGGGLDVWFALQSGAEEIAGVEVNPTSVDLVRDHAAYNGDLYGQPNVRIVIDDGRSILQRDQTQYDLIFLSQLVTLVAERNGYALVENSSYTVEAFGDYLDHLAPNGQIGIKLYDEPTLTRALATALAAFRERGLSDQEGLQHIIALLDADADPPIPLLIIGKEAFTRDDALTLGAVAQQVGFTPLFLPGVVARAPLDSVAAGEATIDEITASAENDLSPTTDDRPFFYQFERGIPAAMRPLLLAVFAVLLIGTVLLVIFQRRGAAGRWAAASPLYFAGLGLGFILVEIGVIQQTRLFLGHPTTAITLVLAVLLISGGMGSGLAGRYVRRKQTLTVWPVLAVILIVAAWLLLWPFIQAQFLAAPPLVRMLVVAACLVPLGLLMGMPFPLGLQAVAGHGQRQVPLAWTVNGIMSVAGSVLAVTVAILLGFTFVLVAGGLAYGLTAVAALLVSPRSG